MTLRKNPFEHIVGKGENTGNHHFLLLPQCFLPIKDRNYLDILAKFSKNLKFGSVQKFVIWKRV